LTTSNNKSLFLLTLTKYCTCCLYNVPQFSFASCVSAQCSKSLVQCCGSNPLGHELFYQESFTARQRKHLKSIREKSKGNSAIKCRWCLSLFRVIQIMRLPINGHKTFHLYCLSHMIFATNRTLPVKRHDGYVEIDKSFYTTFRTTFSNVWSLSLINHVFIPYLDFTEGLPRFVCKFSDPSPFLFSTSATTKGPKQTARLRTYGKIMAPKVKSHVLFVLRWRLLD
jgi:hypothetical protein